MDASAWSAAVPQTFLCSEDTNVLRKPTDHKLWCESVSFIKIKPDRFSPFSLKNELMSHSQCCRMPRRRRRPSHNNHGEKSVFSLSKLTSKESRVSLCPLISLHSTDPGHMQHHNRVIRKKLPANEVSMGLENHFLCCFQTHSRSFGRCRSTFQLCRNGNGRYTKYPGPPGGPRIIRSHAIR